MIRLGSLAGYPFEGPRALAGWTPPETAAVYAVLCKSDENASERYSVIFVGHADDLSAERLPFKHQRSASWIRRAGSRWNLHVAYYEVPGGLRSHREQIARELISVYRPSCNPDQYEQAWRDEWIGEDSTPERPLPSRPDPAPEGAELPRRRVVGSRGLIRNWH